MNKKTVRLIAIIMALVMAVSLIIGIVSSLTADARVTQSQINKLREEREDIRRRKQEVQSRINEIEFEKLGAVAQKQVLDDRIILTGYEIENITETIEDLTLLIVEKEHEVEAAIVNEMNHLETYKERVRSMEENGVISYLEIIFNSGSFSDLLARIDFVGDIMKADETTYYALIDAREETKAAKVALEDTKEEMEEELELKIQKEAELVEQIEEASAIIKKLEEDIETETELRNEIALEEEIVQKEINEKVEQLRRQEAAARARAIVGTGRFIWPVPSSGNVTSGFGSRMHPVFRVVRQHNGIDIAAKHGANIVAADRGTVITSAYNSSYGHYVVVSHGNGMTTLYAHMSSRKASAGDTVDQGQVIGLIGSTGVSTGPHLHFEVSSGGSRQNPMHYFSRSGR